MPQVIGLDIGTTTISGIVLNTDDGQMLARVTREHGSDVSLTESHQAGWAEQNPQQLWQSACFVLGELAQNGGREASAIGLTGQMHGLLIVDRQNEPQSRLITWQDQRAAGLTDELIAAAPAEAWHKTGCRLATGYQAATLAWLVRHHALPKSAHRVCFIHDWIASRLSDTVCCTDPSDAASAGILDLTTKNWSPTLVSALKLPSELLPEVRESGAVLGELRAEVAGPIGLRPGAAVCNAIGDNQASFLGSVADPQASLLLNIGTGGQISWTVDALDRQPGTEIRYLPIDRKITVGASICGGRAYAWLEGFYRRTVETLTGRPVASGAFYESMNRLAATAATDAGGLQCAPILAGTRLNPSLRGRIDGMSLTNFDVPNLTRAVLTGIVDELLAFYQGATAADRSAHRAVIGSGNAIRRNSLLARIISQQLRLPIWTPVHLEEAACGAALLAAVGAGILPSLVEAGRLIAYHDVASSTTL